MRRVIQIPSQSESSFGHAETLKTLGGPREPCAAAAPGRIHRWGSLRSLCPAGCIRRVCATETSLAPSKVKNPNFPVLEPFPVLSCISSDIIPCSLFSLLTPPSSIFARSVSSLSWFWAIPSGDSIMMGREILQRMKVSGNRPLYDRNFPGAELCNILLSNYPVCRCCSFSWIMRLKFTGPWSKSRKAEIAGSLYWAVSTSALFIVFTDTCLCYCGFLMFDMMFFKEIAWTDEYDAILILDWRDSFHVLLSLSHGPSLDLQISINFNFQ